MLDSKGILEEPIIIPSDLAHDEEAVKRYVMMQWIEKFAVFNKLCAPAVIEDATAIHLIFEHFPGFRIAETEKKKGRKLTKLYSPADQIGITWWEEWLFIDVKLVKLSGFKNAKKAHNEKDAINWLIKNVAPYKGKYTYKTLSNKYYDVKKKFDPKLRYKAASEVAKNMDNTEPEEKLWMDHYLWCLKKIVSALEDS